MRQGISDLESEIECVSSTARPSRSKRKDFRELVNQKGVQMDDTAYILECGCDDVDDKVAMSFIHAFFSENFDNDLGTMVKGHP
jgi:hypothetical protein